jgi:hypothetical protein
MGRTTALRDMVKRDFVPFLEGKAFVLDMRDAPRLYRFHKIDRGFEFECSVQWEKYGSPRFILNFSKRGRGREGLIASGRLAPSRRRSTDGWFRQDRPWLQKLVSFFKLYPAEKVVAQLKTLFVEVEDYWKSGMVGPHIHLLPVPRRPRRDG